jgi:hypothetical protein
MRKNKIATIFVLSSFCVIVVLQCSFSNVSAVTPPTTTPTIVWHQDFSISDFANNYNVVIQTSDGGYAMTGMAGVLNLGNIGPWLVKYDATGKQQWSQPYVAQFKNGFSGLISGGPSSLVQTKDGGFALGGRFNDGASIIKTDSEGNIQWNQTYPGVNGAEAVIKTSDDGFAVLGSKNSEFWLGKTDSAGQLQWSQTYTNENSTAVTVIQTKDDGYAIFISVNPYRSYAQALLIKTDDSGKPSWTRTYDFPMSFLKPRAFMQTSDGGYALAANSNDKLCLIKTDAASNTIWNRMYNGFGNLSYSVIQTRDGGYALGAGETSGPFPPKGNLLKLDVAGNLEWNMSADGPVSSIVEVNEEHYTFSVNGNGKQELICIDSPLIFSSPLPTATQTTPTTIPSQSAQPIASSTPIQTGVYKNSNELLIAGIAMIIVIATIAGGILVLKRRRKAQVNSLT